MRSQRSGRAVYCTGLAPKGCPTAKTGTLHGFGLSSSFVECIMLTFYKVKIKTFYYGHTSDLNRRLEKHNSGKVRYTKGKGPWKLVYSEPFESKSEAYRRELFFKSIEGYRYLKEKGII